MRKKITFKETAIRLPETDSILFSTETKKLEDKGKDSFKVMEKNKCQTKISPITLLEEKRKGLHNLLCKASIILI